MSRWAGDNNSELFEPQVCTNSSTCAKAGSRFSTFGEGVNSTVFQMMKGRFTCPDTCFREFRD